MQEWTSAQDKVKTMPYNSWTGHSLFLAHCAAAAMQAQHSKVQAKAQGLVRSMSSCGDTWTLSLPTCQLITHTGQWAVKSTSQWYSQDFPSTVWTWNMNWPPIQSSCVLIKEYWVKIHPETNTYSQMSAGTVPELDVGVRKEVEISDSRRGEFTPTLCQQSCQFFMQMVLFSAK